MRFDGVHAFGYNSTGSEPIWWNLGHSENIVYRWRWQILGAIRAEARARELGEILFFCEVNNARLYRFPVGQISRNLHARRGSDGESFRNRIFKISP